MVLTGYDVAIKKIYQTISFFHLKKGSHYVAWDDPEQAM